MHWNRIPRDIESPSLEVLNRHVDVALGDIVWGLGASGWTAGLENVKSLFQDEQFFGSLKLFFPGDIFCNKFLVCNALLYYWNY